MDNTQRSVMALLRANDDGEAPKNCRSIRNVQPIDTLYATIYNELCQKLSLESVRFKAPFDSKLMLITESVGELIDQVCSLHEDSFARETQRYDYDKWL